MPKSAQEILDAIRLAAKALERSPSKAEFKRHSGISEYLVMEHFPSWREAVRAAGLESSSTNIKLEDEALLDDWGELVRKHRQIPTRNQYRRDGKYSPGAFERHFGTWSTIPNRFWDYAHKKEKWADVLALLPVATFNIPVKPALKRTVQTHLEHSGRRQHPKLEDRATYGDPLDFRGLRHEPVNEQGVVFLFGMVARELGYLVEAVQSGFPDCEAKRQLGPGKWQTVRIEFEFESKSFRDHGHPPEGCDIIVCWRHNWSDCPSNLEILELSSVIRQLSKSED